MVSGGSGGGEPPRRPYQLPKSHAISYLWDVDWEAIEQAEEERSRREKDYERRWGTRLPSPVGSKGKSPSRSQRSGEALAISTRLRRRYPNVPPVLIDQIADAKLILMDRRYVEAKLRELQTQMVEQNLTLDQALSEAERVEGFQPRQVVSDLLSRDQFRQILLGMYQIFDVGTPYDHGPHTHRLQWYVLYRAHSDGRLVVPPRLLYRVLGTPQFIHNERRTIWDDVFDFDDDAAEIIGQESGDQARIEAGYSSPEGGLSRLIRTERPLRGGPLEMELRLLSLITQTLGAEAILNPRPALIQAIVMKEFMKNMSLDLSKLREELEKLTTPELFNLYFQHHPNSPLKKVMK